MTNEAMRADGYMFPSSIHLEDNCVMNSECLLKGSTGTESLLGIVMTPSCSQVFQSYSLKPLPPKHLM